MKVSSSFSFPCQRCLMGLNSHRHMFSSLQITNRRIEARGGSGLGLQQHDIDSLDSIPSLGGIGMCSVPSILHLSGTDRNTSPQL